MVIIILAAVLTALLILPIPVAVSAGFYNDVLPVVSVKIFGIKIFEQKTDINKIDVKKKPPYFLLKAFTLKKLSVRYTCGYVKLANTLTCMALALGEVSEKFSKKANFSFALEGNSEGETLIININAVTNAVKIIARLFSEKGIKYAKSIGSNSANS